MVVPLALGGPTPAGPGIAPGGGPPGGPPYGSDPFYPRDRERGPIDLMRDQRDRDRDLRDRDARIELLRMGDRDRERERPPLMDPRDPAAAMRLVPPPDRADLMRGDSRAVADLRERDRGDRERVERDAREVKRIKTEGRKMDRQGTMFSHLHPTPPIDPPPDPYSPPIPHPAIQSQGSSASFAPRPLFQHIPLSSYQFLVHQTGPSGAQPGQIALNPPPGQGPPGPPSQSAAGGPTPKLPPAQGPLYPGSGPIPGPSLQPPGSVSERDRERGERDRDNRGAPPTPTAANSSGPGGGPLDVPHTPTSTAAPPPPGSSQGPGGNQGGGQGGNQAGQIALQPPPGSQALGPTGGVPPQGVMDFGLDPHTVPPELKKEGSDWFAIFNPSPGVGKDGAGPGGRRLDVDLVHTLIHERYVGYPIVNASSYSLP